jgi:hypothetical protein
MFVYAGQAMVLRARYQGRCCRTATDCMGQGAQKSAGRNAKNWDPAQRARYLSPGILVADIKRFDVSEFKSDVDTRMCNKCYGRLINQEQARPPLSPPPHPLLYDPHQAHSSTARRLPAAAVTHTWRQDTVWQGAGERAGSRPHHPLEDRAWSSDRVD